MKKEYVGAPRWGLIIHDTFMITSLTNHMHKLSNANHYQKMEPFLGHGLASNSHDIDQRKGHHPPSYNILCAFHRGYIQMTFFFKIYVFLNIWNLIYPLFQSFFEHATTLSYSFYQKLSNTMLQSLHQSSFDPCFMGFVVKNQTINLIPSLSFGHKS